MDHSALLHLLNRAGSPSPSTIWQYLPPASREEALALALQHGPKWVKPVLVREIVSGGGGFSAAKLTVLNRRDLAAHAAKLSLKKQEALAFSALHHYLLDTPRIAIQAEFLDAAGVTHDGTGRLEEATDGPRATEDAVAEAVRNFWHAAAPEGDRLVYLAALTAFAAKSNHLGAAGLALLLATALALVLTIDRTLNRIWRVREVRSFTHRVLVYWAALTLGPLLLGLSLTLTSYALSASRGWVTGVPGFVGHLIDLIQFLLLVGGATVLFRFVPNTYVEGRHALAGGVFVAAGVELAKQVLGWYLVVVPTYGSVFGAFAVMPILMLWVYCVWVVVLLGAVIAAYAPSLTLGFVSRRGTPGWRFDLMLAVIAELRRAWLRQRERMRRRRLARSAGHRLETVAFDSAT